MRALVVDPSAVENVRLAEVADPAAGPGQILVEVHRAGLNHGDLNDARSGRLPSGAVLGSDAAGVVLDADGGPARGSRVVAMVSGAFAERVAVDLDAAAVVPRGVDLDQAAAVPVAGLAAWRALRAAGPLLGRRALITGASGGVGRFAVRLASIAGAYVIAVVGSRSRGEGLAEAGADEVAVLLDHRPREDADLLPQRRSRWRRSRPPPPAHRQRAAHRRHRLARTARTLRRGRCRTTRPTTRRQGSPEPRRLDGRVE